MKLALFFFLSLAVHGAALLIPVSLNGRAAERAIVVAILPIESANESSGYAGVNKMIGRTSKEPPVAAAPTPTPVAAPTPVVETPSLAADKIITSVVAVSTTGASNYGGAMGAPGLGNGAGNSPVTGAGKGSGGGDGTGNGTAGAVHTQARYRDTPQPHYPDSARRAGKEGRVLLRVLVDEEGRAKAVEVNTSSGHDMLDQAASEALKKWRFVPAHADGRPIETWVKVPIEFQLSNNNR